MEWIRDRNPEEHGYYLGAWLRQGRWVTSELWYNPDSMGTGWWASRGYFHQKDPGTTIDVKAWMKMPKFDPLRGRLLAYKALGQVFDPEDMVLVYEQRH